MHNCKQLSNFDHPLFSAVSLTTGINNWRKNIKGERINRIVLRSPLPVLQSWMFMGEMSNKNSRKSPLGLIDEFSSNDVACAESSLSIPCFSISFAMATSNLCIHSVDINSMFFTYLLNESWSQSINFEKKFKSKRFWKKDFIEIILVIVHCLLLKKARRVQQAQP